MKKILLIVAVIAAALTSLSASAETRWGVTAATNISTMKFNQPLASTSQVCNFSFFRLRIDKLPLRSSSGSFRRSWHCSG